MRKVLTVLVFALLLALQTGAIASAADLGDEKSEWKDKKWPIVK